MQDYEAKYDPKYDADRAYDLVMKEKELAAQLAAQPKLGQGLQSPSSTEISVILQQLEYLNSLLVTNRELISRVEGKLFGPQPENSDEAKSPEPVPSLYAIHEAIVMACRQVEHNNETLYSTKERL